MVLEVQWNLDKYDVEDIMNDFKKKSLAWMTENIEMNAYIYSIHDLHLDYLKDNCKDKIDLHRNFVNQYLEKCYVNGKYYYGLLPDDKYIHYFLAYHLYTAEQYEVLEEIFLDLNFIEKKLKYVGPSDLLNDYQIYEECFKKTEEKNCFEKFIRNNAHLVNKENVDIIQLALLEPVESVVYMKARDIASERNNPYFQWCNISSSRNYIMLTTKPHEGAVNCAIFGPNDAIAVSAGEDKVIRVLSGLKGKLKCNIEAEDRDGDISTCCLSPDCQKVVYGTKIGAVKLCYVESEDTIDYPGHNDEVTYSTFFSDSHAFVTCSNDCTLKIWKGNEITECVGHTKGVTYCKPFCEDKKLISCSVDGSIRVWEVTSGTQLLECFGHGNETVTYCDVSSNEQYLASASADCTVVLWNAETGNQIAQLSSECCMRCCCFSPNSRFLATGDDDGKTQIWEINKNPKTAITLSKHDRWVHKILFSSDSQQLVSVANSIKWWNVNGQLLQTFDSGGEKYHIFSSEDFSTFVTVDTCGTLYILKRLET